MQSDVEQSLPTFFAYAKDKQESGQKEDRDFRLKMTLIVKQQQEQQEIAQGYNTYTRKISANWKSDKNMQNIALCKVQKTGENNKRTCQELPSYPHRSCNQKWNANIENGSYAAFYAVARPN